MKIIVFLVLCFLGLSKSLETAKVCKDNNCLLSENCRCSSSGAPFSLEETPQLISLTFDEAIVDNLYHELWKPVLFDRRNPDGNPISATFYVPHEYTDYQHVQELYLRGFEIGVNSITKNPLAEYWSHASEDTLKNEFGGQRLILSHFANIPIDDIIGARAPQLQIEGDTLINAYVETGIQYDNSWTSRNSNPFYPYTLDYLSNQECRSDTSCPKESHPGFWILPINNILGNNSVECNALTNCNIYGSADEIASWLLGQIQRVKSSTRAPISLLVPSAWFRFIDNSFEGFRKFLDLLKQQNDVFLVSQKQVLDWIKNPVHLADFQSNVPDRHANCSALNCMLFNDNGQVRYMKSCVSCPEVYPWLGNPLGKL